MTFDSPGSAESGAEPTPEETPSPAPAPQPEPDEPISVRRGMFGVSGTGDTSGYGGLVETVTIPSSTPSPYGGWFDAFVGTVRAALTQRAIPFNVAIAKVVVFRDEITLHVRRGHLLDVAQALRDEQALRFELCLGVNGVHYPDDTGRELHAIYHLLSITHRRRVRLEVTAPDNDARLPSLFSVYPTVDWHERETYDFFGIVFDGHPSLTRIMMPDDWRGHPQRKDYPLGGIPVEYKGARIPPPDERRTYS
ncbi:NADH-quinone oxidoreductase subunit C [Nocardia camponoti]|uniref:NADH-quinone oxidoreductase subunit C n=1 Tax=Nocardia camponoti TaxID=1616106 RepID=A0A917Q8S9_9NOCA|nr:NADH-quinone oxidoreductase subunit C [Nocardia camponoti]GGK35453.1 NADH-quinone oxidoreductase subunit C [Nocardia camponoti]